MFQRGRLPHRAVAVRAGRPALLPEVRPAASPLAAEGGRSALPTGPAAGRPAHQRGGGDRRACSAPLLRFRRGVPGLDGVFCAQVLAEVRSWDLPPLPERYKKACHSLAVGERAQTQWLRFHFALELRKI